MDSIPATRQSTTRYEVRNLPRGLSIERRLQLGESLQEIDNEINEKKEEKKAVTARFNVQIKDLEEQQKKILGSLTDKSELLPVRCRWDVDYANGIACLIDPETGNEVDRQRLSEDEDQLFLHMDDSSTNEQSSDEAEELGDTWEGTPTQIRLLQERTLARLYNGEMAAAIAQLRNIEEGESVPTGYVTMLTTAQQIAADAVVDDRDDRRFFGFVAIARLVDLVDDAYEHDLLPLSGCADFYSVLSDYPVMQDEVAADGDLSFSAWRDALYWPAEWLRENFRIALREGLVESALIDARELQKETLSAATRTVSDELIAGIMWDEAGEDTSSDAVIDNIALGLVKWLDTRIEEGVLSEQECDVLVHIVAGELFDDMPAERWMDAWRSYRPAFELVDNLDALSENAAEQLADAISGPQVEDSELSRVLDLEDEECGFRAKIFQVHNVQTAGWIVRVTASFAEHEKQMALPADGEEYGSRIVAKENALEELRTWVDSIPMVTTEGERAKRRVIDLVNGFLEESKRSEGAEEGAEVEEA